MPRPKKNSAKDMRNKGMTLTNKQKMFIVKKVTSLGSAEKVELAYCRDDLVSVFAIEFARNLFKEV